jgi:hypothetical protein
VRRIAVAVVLVTSAALPAVADAGQYLSFGEAGYRLRTLIRAAMKREGRTWDGSFLFRGLSCRRAPARAKDRATCDARWSDTTGRYYCGEARVVKYRTYYSRSLRSHVRALSEQCYSLPPVYFTPGVVRG